MKTTLIAPDIDEADMRRFWAKVALPNENGCLLWTAATNHMGYGAFGYGSRDGRTAPVVSAHRFAYTALVGEIPGGLVLDHLCRVPACVAPDHLEAVTNAENIRRGNGGLFHALKTHCPRGHAYDDVNTYLNPRGSRECRKCQRASADAWRSTHRDVVNAAQNRRRAARRVNGGAA